MISLIVALTILGTATATDQIHCRAYGWAAYTVTVYAAALTYLLVRS